MEQPAWVVLFPIEQRQFISLDALSDAVPKSTYGAKARIGVAGSPDMWRFPDIDWASPSKPTLLLHGPPLAKALTGQVQAEGNAR